jgi:hypothetical protein
MGIETFFVLDEFRPTVVAGDSFRLLPLGTLVKNGKKREITRALLEKFRLPHFRPPIKLGSHKDETAAAGFIIGLEVRDDGLYALTELTEAGAQAFAQGAYRYHSPEIIWEGGLEHPTTGLLIEGPLIVGDALLHTPHLGEAAALYSVNPMMEEKIMTEQTVTVPLTWFDKLLGKQPEPAPEPAPAPQAKQDNYAAQVDALQAERDDLAAKVAAMEAQARRDGRVQEFAAEFKATPLADDAELHGALANLPDETAALLTRKYKSLAEAVRVSNLTTDMGHPGADESADPIQAFDAAVRAKMSESKTDYGAAVKAVITEQPDLFRAYQGAR